MARKKATKTSRGKSTAMADAEIGSRIRAIRLDRGMSQKTLGDHLGLTFQQVQKYEKGTNRVAGGRIQQIAAIFKVNTDQLLGANTPGLDGFSFDTESYKLAREFSGLPHHLKSRFRTLIRSIIEGPDDK
jgi:transcriptional regulator with XRE-family HTH domain